MSKPIVVVGSLNADLVTRLQRFPAPGETLTALDFQKFSGGKGANQAYAAGRLGGTVHMVGRVGNDGYGGWLVEQLQGGGVDTSHVGCDDSAATGMAFINLDASGQNQIVIAGPTRRYLPTTWRPAPTCLRTPATCSCSWKPPCPPWWPPREWPRRAAPR